MPCWAESLKDCSNKLSREHIVSEGAFPYQTLRVKGLPWCLDEFKEISIASFTRKVLCERHNNSLTDSDQAYINAMQCFRDEVPLYLARNKMKPIRWTLQKFQIDGAREVVSKDSHQCPR